MITPDDLRSIANSQGRGYLKEWKAVSIVGTIKSIPEIASNRDRLRKYIATCLEMEGFSPAGVDAVTDAIHAAQ